jgi:hypothetical protein
LTISNTKLMLVASMIQKRRMLMMSALTILSACSNRERSRDVSLLGLCAVVESISEVRDSRYMRW